MLPPAGAGDTAEDQWVRHDGTPVASVGSVIVTPSQRLVTYADIHRWFAPQQVNLAADSPFGPSLTRLHRGNLVTPLVDGYEAFAEIVKTIQAVKDSGGADASVNFAGWDFHHRFDLVPRFVRSRYELPEDGDLTLLALTEALSGERRTTRFLVNRFFNLDDTPPPWGRDDADIVVGDGHRPVSVKGESGLRVPHGKGNRSARRAYRCVRVGRGIGFAYR